MISIPMRTMNETSIAIEEKFLCEKNTNIEIKKQIDEVYDAYENLSKEETDIYEESEREEDPAKKCREANYI